MRIKALEAFCKLVELGGIAPAAEAMYCVPSNITKMVKDLERDLSEPLFNRIRGRLIITPFGRQYYHDVLQLVTLNTSLTSKYRQKEGIYTLTIGAIDVAADHWLPERMAAFTEKNPDIRLHLIRGYSHELEAALYNHDVDVIFSDGPIVTPEIVSTPAFTEHLVLTGDPRDTAMDPLPLYSFGEKCFYQKVTKNWLTTQPINKFQLTDMESYPAMAALIRRGTGVAFIPECMLESLNCTSLVTAGIKIPCQVYGAWSKENQHTAIKLLINAICQTSEL